MRAVLSGAVVQVVAKRVQFQSVPQTHEEATQSDMTNVLAINRILPPISIQTDYLARIKSGRSDRALDLFVPPAGWLEPTVSARDLLSFALIEIGRDQTEADIMADTMAQTLLATLPLTRRPIMLEDYDQHACAAVTDVIRPLSVMGNDKAIAVAEILGQLAETAATTPAFVARDVSPDLVCLRDLGPDPLPAGLSEYWCGIGGSLVFYLTEVRKAAGERKMLDWRDNMGPHILALEEKVGASLFHFADLDDERDDDQSHRFLALDYVCAMMPDSSFVNYLCEVSGAPSINSLRLSLRAPDLYASDFRLFPGWGTAEVARTQELFMPSLR